MLPAGRCFIRAQASDFARVTRCPALLQPFHSFWGFPMLALAHVRAGIRLAIVDGTRLPG